MMSNKEATTITSTVLNSNTTAAGDEFQLLEEAVHSLPSSQAVQDLMSIAVCTRCIFRLFGIRGSIYSSSCLSPSVISSILSESTCTKDSSLFKKSEEIEPELCSICLGILQLIYFDDNGMRVKKKSANNLAGSIAELIKQDGHQIDSFSLEVSTPQIILENEEIVILYMRGKYGSEHWFQERFSKCISTKEALKFAIVNPLENILDVKSGPSSCRIRLTYTQTKSSDIAPNTVEGGEGCKRRKTDPSPELETINDKLVDASNESSDSSKDKGNISSKCSSNVLEGHEASEHVIFPKDKVSEPCRLGFLCYRTPIFFGGRYLKFSRNVSQTRWIIDDERKGEASVEEIIGGNILPMCQGDSYKFHAAGREDIDVRMLGSGRPFLVEIQNARVLPSKSLVKEVETKINSSNNELVGVKNLKIVDNQGWSLMHEGEAEKQKQYCALVWISRPIEDQDLHSIASLKDLQILQRTPIRVLHRRSPLEREKIIHWLKIETIADSSQYFLLHLCTQAGTYIKEFVHGDLGRTHPSIGSILGCRAEILQLDVTEVKMDCFLAE